MSKTATYQLIERDLDSDLESFVKEKRAAGQSWEAIAREIYDRTRIAVTSATIRNWFAESISA